MKLQRLSQGRIFYHYFNKFILIFFGWCLIGFNLPVYSINLLEVYQIALCKDPVYQAAKHQYLATKQQLPIAVSALLPQITALGSLEYQGINMGVQNEKLFSEIFDLNLNQTIINLGEWFTVSKANARIKQEAATLQAAALNLMIRCAQAYINILAAYDDLKFAQAEKITFAKQYEQTKQRFEVGLAAITGVQEAKAKYDSKYAEVIAKKNELQNAKEQLRLLIGFTPTSVSKLSQNIPLHLPKPADITGWVCKANQQNYQLISARYAALVQKRSVSIAKAQHAPTLNFNFIEAGLNAANAAPLFGIDSPGLTNTWSGNITVTLNIYQGGLVLANTSRESNLYSVSLDNLEEVQRNIESNTRQDYRNVATEISEVKALEESVISGNLALNATHAGFTVGTRTSVDVLERTSELYDQKRKLAFAKYLYILNSLKLKEDAGILCPKDIVAINTWLAPSSDAPDAILSDYEALEDVKKSTPGIANTNTKTNNFKPQAAKKAVKKNVKNLQKHI